MPHIFGGLNYIPERNLDKVLTRTLSSTASPVTRGVRTFWNVAWKRLVFLRKLWLMPSWYYQSAAVEKCDFRLPYK